MDADERESLTREAHVQIRVAPTSRSWEEDLDLPGSGHSPGAGQQQPLLAIYDSRSSALAAARISHRCNPMSCLREAILGFVDGVLIPARRSRCDQRDGTN